jgi:hypothetical protein
VLCNRWAAIFERWLARQPQHTPLLIIRDAAAMSAIAAAVDYGITPKRATPGWEEVLSRAPSAGPMADGTRLCRRCNAGSRIAPE